MIIGIGSDITDIRRIQSTLDRFGQRFLLRVFTAAERARAAGKVDPAATLAKRFAAKEACAKALGTGLRRGIFWRHMEVLNAPGGKPVLHLSAAAAQRLEALTPAGHIASVDLTLSDEPPYALAFVIISSYPQS